MYESILATTLDIIGKLPTPVPEQGNFAGITEMLKLPWYNEMFRKDNYHYPMGTTYLNMGIGGVIKKAEAKAQETTDPKKKELLEGIAAVYQEISAYFVRYAKNIYEAAGEDKRLLKIADTLMLLSEKAPEHFDEALQLLYLVWKMRSLRATSDWGRLDVHLRKWFDADIASGYMTEEDALDLLIQLWTMINKNGSGDTLMQLMVGGCNADGSDAGSRLSVLMLEATKRTGFTDPHLNVRVHKNLHPDIYKLMLEVQAMGQGQATLYNDEVVIPSLIAYGVPEEMAYCYTNDGCTEIILDGYSFIEFQNIDAVGAFELAFNNGNWAGVNYRRKNKYYHKDNEERFYTPNVVPGFESGRPEDCETFEEFYQMFLKQYKVQVRNKANVVKRIYEDRMAGEPSSLVLNGTYDSVLESGKDHVGGGLPFDGYMVFSGSITTVADCLAALKLVVFEKKLYTIAEVKEAIRVNYEGHEIMRRQLAAAPKFGNDIDEVDEIATDIADHFCKWLEEFREETGFAIMPGLYGWEFLDESFGVAATPDGRRYGDPIAEHYCATPGKAVNGPTALIQSIAKAREAIFKSVGVCAVNVTLPSNLGSEEERLNILDGMNKTAIEGGLNMMNIGIYDKDILLKAKEDPENYKDVTVRVWGYSARFVELCEDMQNHIISRIS